MFRKNEKQEEGHVKILGTGCSKCNELERNVRKAISELGYDWEVGHVSDMRGIAKYGVMVTPALVVGEDVVSAGKVLTVDEAKAVLEGRK